MKSQLTILTSNCLKQKLHSLIQKASLKTYQENLQHLIQMQQEPILWPKELKGKKSDIEEELKVVGNNLQILEVGEEKTIQREEKSQENIMELVYKLKRSEYRGEQADMHVQRLNVRIDQVEEDLLTEKYKIKKISDEVNQTFDDMLNLAVQKRRSVDNYSRRTYIINYNVYV